MKLISHILTAGGGAAFAAAVCGVWLHDIGLAVGMSLIGSVLMVLGYTATED